jgi:hypothetical protein
VDVYGHVPPSRGLSLPYRKDVQGGRKKEGREKESGIRKKTDHKRFTNQKKPKGRTLYGQSSSIVEEMG